MDLPKHYDPKASEEKWQTFWSTKQLFRFDEKSSKPVFSIDTPPPYVSADHLHLGHTLSYSQTEFVARYRRMKGYNVFYPMGFDDNGLPTERFVEKKYKVDKRNTSRKDFVTLCLEETKKGAENYRKLWNRLGLSVDWQETYSTINKRAQIVSQHSFIDLYAKGKLLHHEEPTLWCMKCQTTIAQADLTNIDMSSHFNDIIFKAKEEELVIATTRPELLPACVGLFANPDDERYLHLKGKFATVPLFNYEVPILFDEAVDKETGTGLMMVCTFGDKEDIEKWHKYNLQLRIVFNEDGTLTSTGGAYAGMKIKEARKAIIEDLEKEGLLVAQKQITHAVNVHERCSTEVEFLKKKQWTIDVLSEKEALLAQADKISWYPEFMKTRYNHWVQNLQWNWSISRQRFYGVPFPVWYCTKCSAIKLPDIKDLPIDPREDKPRTPCTCGSSEFVGEEDVMDTWMTSSVSPYINANWLSRKTLVPASLRPQAHDIIRTWAFYTIAKAYLHFNDIPWKDIVISGHGLDAKGRKMSKSLGNSIDPSALMDKYSADALRYFAASQKLGEDQPFQEKEFQNGQKLVTKLWNASKFAIMQLEGYSKEIPKELAIVDRWLFCELDAVIAEATAAFEEHNYSKAKYVCEQFFWGTFCDQYLEIVKERAYNKEKNPEGSLSAQYTLYVATLSIIKLFAPILPHITEEIYQMYFKTFEHDVALAVSSWPECTQANKDAEDLFAFGKELVHIVTAARKFKSEQNLSLREPLTVVSVSASQIELLQEAEQDILGATKAQTLILEKGELAVSLEK
ncbi:MAG: valine--tRNA ligase [Candidatus Woesearchaeota archaeon]|nr:MAG: valine--tRNA ligase [Candidatus Woesearchaeota archaeon]